MMGKATTECRSGCKTMQIVRDFLSLSSMVITVRSTSLGAFHCPFFSCLLVFALVRTSEYQA